MRRTITVAILFAVAFPTLARSAVNGDPFERFNRRNYALNAVLDKLFIRPLSQLTHGLTPGPIGLAVRNVLNTLNEPVVILNDILQLRPARAARSAARLIVNSTIGLLGTVDAAKKFGIPHRPNGFGDTLGRYGVKPGPYLFLPLAGPTDLRDLFGTGVDTVSSPIFFVKYAYKNDVLLTLNIVGGLNMRAEAEDDLKALYADAADPYATLRSTYLQMRQGEIDEGRTPAALPDIGDVPATPPPPAGEGGPRGGSDEGSRPIATPSDAAPSPADPASPHPSAAPPPSPAGGEGSPTIDPAI